MRKIDEEMADAFANNRCYSNGNTQVFASSKYARVLVHGNEIAYKEEDGIAKINMETLKRYPTNLTLNRLRALGFNVRRKNREVEID